MMHMLIFLMQKMHLEKKLKEISYFLRKSVESAFREKKVRIKK